MNKIDMLLGGPGLDGYAYQAEVYCVACGQAIIAAGPAEIPEPFDCDSDTTPQPVFFGESHSAQYCAECGEYLYGNLGEPEYPDKCIDPAGHDWVFTGTQYGGDDKRWHGEGRCLCRHCGADGDA